MYISYNGFRFQVDKYWQLTDQFILSITRYGSYQMCLLGLHFGESHEIICLNMVVLGLLTFVIIATMWICCCPCATYKICCKSDTTYEKKRKKERALTLPLFQKNKKKMSSRPLLL